MATFKLAYIPDAPPAGLPPVAKRYLDQELQKIAALIVQVNTIMTNHEIRIQTLEP